MPHRCDHRRGLLRRSPGLSQLRSHARPATGLNRPLLVLLGTATALASIAACALAQDQHYRGAARILLLALVFGQTNLLALFLGLGTAHGIVRLIAATAGIAVWAVALGRAADVPPDQAAVFLGLQAGAVALCAAVGRSAGIRWSAAAPADDVAPTRTSNRRQFTLLQLLGWITWVAVLAALGRQATFPLGTAGIHQAVFLSANLLIGLTAAWAASTADRPLPRTAILVAAAAGLVPAMNTLLPSSSQVGGPDMALFVLQALFVVGWLGAGRAAGLRIGRDPAG